MTPITRVDKFFSFEDNELELSMIREWVEGDGNFTIILYRVDRMMTQSDELYGEAVKDGIRWLPPIELKVLPVMAAPDNKAYNPNGTLEYLQDGQLSFGIYQAQLTELKVDINFGDYIGYPISENELRYFSVVNDGRKFFDNAHTFMGYKGVYRNVLCSPIDSSEFQGL